MNPPYLIIFFSSLTVLAFEITLVRVFSIRFSYHYASLIISISMLGLVLGGIWAYFVEQRSRGAVSPSRPPASSHSRMLTPYVFALSLSYPLVFIVSSIAPFDHYRALWEDIQILYLLFFVLPLSVPFFLYGIVLSSVLYIYSEKANKVYAADLAGAAMGIVLSMFLLNHTDVERIIVACAATLSILLFFKVRKNIFGTVCLLLSPILCLPVLLGFVTLAISPYKGLTQALKDDGARHIQTINTSHGRLDVFSNPRMKSAPGLSLAYERPVPGGFGVSIDGDLIGVFLEENGMKDYEFLRFVPSALPFIMKESPVVLVAGFKGSVDVLTPYYTGAKTVYKAEANLSVLRFLHGHYKDGSLHGRSLYGISGRRLMKFLHEKIDIVYLSGTGFFPAGAFGLAEDYDTTVDAFQYYLANMNQGGILYVQTFVLPPPRYELRIFSNLVQALDNLALGDYEKRLVVFRTWDTMNFLVKPSGFTTDEDKRVKSFLATNQFDIVYPSFEREARFIEGLNYEKILGDLADRKKRVKAIGEYAFDIRPTTDDRPFFNYFLKVNKIKEVYTLSGQKWSYFLHEGMMLPFLGVLLLFVASVIFTATFLAGIHKARTREPQARPKTGYRQFFPWTFYFTLIGLAFMFVEVYFLHTLILPLGSPAAAFSTVLVTLLLSAGAGSMMSGFIKDGRLRPFMYLLPLLLACCAVFFEKVMMLQYSFIVIVPVGIFLGFFFPFGIRTLLKGNPSAIPLAYAVNGAASVISPVLASVIAVEYGLKVLLILAAVLYVATLAMCSLKYSNRWTRKSYKIRKA